FSGFGTACTAMLIAAAAIHSGCFKYFMIVPLLLHSSNSTVLTLLAVQKRQDTSISSARSAAGNSSGLRYALSVILRSAAVIFRFSVGRYCAARLYST